MENLVVLTPLLASQLPGMSLKRQRRSCAHNVRGRSQLPHKTAGSRWLRAKRRPAESSTLLYRTRRSAAVSSTLFIAGVADPFRLSYSSFGFSRLDVRQDDSKSQPTSSNRGEQEEDHRETGVAKHSKRSLDPH